MTRGHRARRHELNTLMLVMADAEGLAAEGKAADGYAALMAGMSRVLEAQEDGEPWEAKARASWESWLFRYTARWGIVRA